jgi:hypothetical protein
MGDGRSYADRMIDVVGAPDSDGYGYALYQRVVEGRTYRGHGGGMVGYISGMSWDPATKAGAVVLQNSPGMAPTALSRMLTRMVAADADGGDPSDVRPDDGSWAAFLATPAGSGPDTSGPPSLTTPTAEQAVVTGTYRSHDPWTPVFRVEARGDRLWLAFPDPPDGAEAGEPLVPMAGGWYRLGADRLGPERIRFDLVIEGRARRAWLSGWPWYRVDRFLEDDGAGG